MLIVALTGFGKEDDREAARVAGFDLHLTKPVDPRTLRAILERATPAPEPR
jgi:CheY-like chemotaxis protein